MNRYDEIRRLIRAADPARTRGLRPVDRARMKAALTSAAVVRRHRRPMAPLLALGVAMATVLVALALIPPRGERHEAASAPLPAIEVLPAPSVASTPARVVATRPTRSRLSRPQVRATRAGDAAMPVTRIVFTGPEGTKILWFVGDPDAKELGS